MTPANHQMEPTRRALSCDHFTAARGSFGTICSPARRMNRVIPVAMKSMPFEPDPRRLRIGDRHASGIPAAIDLGTDPQPGRAVRGADEAHDGREIHQRGPTPVHGDVREQPMFDPVPLARAGREVTDDTIG